MVQAWCHIKDDPKTHLWEEGQGMEIEVLLCGTFFMEIELKGVKFLYGLLAVLSF